MLKSAIYEGVVRHRRFEPKTHSFEYTVFMMYLDLDELEQVFNLHPAWSFKAWRPARFERRDYFGDASIPLSQAVKAHVCAQLGRPITGPVRMLTNLRYFGYIINPISIYYCFDEQDALSAMMLEVTNTPWAERIQYVLDCDPSQKSQRIQFNKAMHVSPFHPMEHFYDWRSSVPTEKLAVHMENKTLPTSTQAVRVVFDATMSLKRHELSRQQLSKTLWMYPFMTAKVVWGIYWQALKLACKRVPFYSHPRDKQKTTKH
jgi:uncharacterized protein